MSSGEATSPAPGTSGSGAVRRFVAGLLVGGNGAFVFPGLVGVLVLLYPVLSGDNLYWMREISLIAVLTLVVSGVNLSFGYAGELQFGQVFMFALGAYLGGVLAIHVVRDIVVLMLLAAGAAALTGVLIAIPALRIGGWSLAMASFFLVITIPDLLSLVPGYTGGLNGLIGIPTATFGGHGLADKGLFYATVAGTIVWLALYRNLVTSRYGTVFRILRESPVLAGSIGFSPRQLKVLAYGAGALPAGVAGCLSGFINFVISPQSFGLTLAIGIIAASVLGGIESIYGAVVGAAILQIGPEKSLSFAQYAPVGYGVFLVVAAILFRGGLGELGQKTSGRLSRRLLGDAAPAAPAAAAAPGGPDASPLQLKLEQRQADILHVTGVSKSFGGVAALDAVSLTAEPGKVTGLIGSNGSGKTTLLNVICGYTKADIGEIAFGDLRLAAGAPHRIARLGVARTFQTPSIPRGVSVADVVASGRFVLDRCGVLPSVLRLPRYWAARRADRREALRLLEFVGLAHLADEEAVSLSLGTRRLVEVARALASKPRLVLLDEPASGLSDEEVELLGRVIRAAADAGATVVLIEHNFRFVGSVSDVVHVLHVGGLIASGTATEVANDPRVVESYLGGRGTATVPEGGPEHPGGSETAPVAAPDGYIATGARLEVKGVVTGYGDLRVLQGVDLSLEPGSVEVVLGRNGVGKTTLLSAITGQLPLWQGSVTLDGTELGGRRAYRRAGAGISLVQEGKRIFRHRTVLENVVVGTYTLALGRRERRVWCESILEQFPILVERRDQPAGGLSGGQQQMLALAQALAARPRVLLLDEPSAGLAPAIVEVVFERVRALADTGLSVMLVEQLAEKALPIADHVTVIDDGKIVASGAPEQFHDLRELQEAYFGADAVGA